MATYRRHPKLSLRYRQSPARSRQRQAHHLQRRLLLHPLLYQPRSRPKRKTHEPIPIGIGPRLPFGKRKGFRHARRNQTKNQPDHPRKTFLYPTRRVRHRQTVYKQPELPLRHRHTTRSIRHQQDTIVSYYLIITRSPAKNAR